MEVSDIHNNPCLDLRTYYLFPSNRNHLLVVETSHHIVNLCHFPIMEGVCEFVVEVESDGLAVVEEARERRESGEGGECRRVDECGWVRKRGSQDWLGRDGVSESEEKDSRE